jgi:hypothetical protein
MIAGRNEEADGFYDRRRRCSGVLELAHYCRVVNNVGFSGSDTDTGTTQL